MPTDAGFPTRAVRQIRTFTLKRSAGFPVGGRAGHRRGDGARYGIDFSIRSVPRVLMMSSGRLLTIRRSV